jgi:hypothetical protein
MSAATRQELALQRRLSDSDSWLFELYFRNVATWLSTENSSNQECLDLEG